MEAILEYSGGDMTGTGVEGVGGVEVLEPQGTGHQRGEGARRGSRFTVP